MMRNPSKSRLSPPSADSIAINVFRSFGYTEEHGLRNVLRHTEMSRQESAGSRKPVRVSRLKEASSPAAAMRIPDQTSQLGSRH